MSEALPRCSRGEIWMLNWEPRRGSEQGGHRPALIIQSDLGNHAPGARTTIVVPLTTQGRPFVFYAPIPKTKENGLPADSWANCTQLFTVDKARLEKRLGKATTAQMAKADEAIKATLDLD
ncbi:MAG TPA: type II toxin-antitoxin system PemK/MazF family toxin [Holophagaceae bacterium]|jgi:mRNA interferase MazF|nr:type II toxin-antitoxin system PemK/MazF family toxin [Holophagaceae bacterium]